MKTSDFNYTLPRNLIAQSPSKPRDCCRLMVLNRDDQKILHTKFNNINEYLDDGDMIVFNDTKVIPARIKLKYNKKDVEIFLTRQISETDWLAIGKPGKLLKPGNEFKIRGLTIKISKIMEDGQRVISFSKRGKEMDRLLNKIGSPPYPPYVTSEKIPFDNYQTIYASKKGSVAAPTAGLHFTNRLLGRLKKKGVQLEFVTLHVGLGTFQPIKVENIKKHTMHKEYYELNEATAKRLNEAINKKKRIIAVGTTSVRVLETSFKTGKGFISGIGETNLYIYPGYKWKCIDALITNFHLPKSSLLLLTCAFGGKDFVFKAYKEAVKEKYRFYSFGDAMFIQ